MTIQMFNIAQTILGSVYASQEAAERLNAPEVLTRVSSERLRADQIRRQRQVQKTEMTEKVTFDPDRNAGLGRRLKQDTQTPEDQQDEDGKEQQLGGHIDIML